VTGAGRGIGVAIADRLLAEGADVAVLDVDGDAAAATAADLGIRHGRPVASIAADVGDVGQVAAALDGDRVDVLVNNAGACTFGPFAESTPDQRRRDLDINLFGVLSVTHAVLPPMLRSGYGRVVNIVSDSARVGELNVAAYAAAKAGVMGFTRALAKEVGRQGARWCPAASSRDAAERVERRPARPARVRHLADRPTELGRPAHVLGAAVGAGDRTGQRALEPGGPQDRAATGADVARVPGGHVPGDADLGPGGDVRDRCSDAAGHLVPRRAREPRGHERDLDPPGAGAHVAQHAEVAQRDRHLGVLDAVQGVVDLLGACGVHHSWIS
jgi:NAD(P)-dependent dehydrogenase (short-subunit alcohol dehydrogenase family)